MRRWLEVRSASKRHGRRALRSARARCVTASTLVVRRRSRATGRHPEALRRAGFGAILAANRQRVDEFRGDERAQVVDALADADELAAGSAAPWRSPRPRRPWRCRRAWSGRARSGRAPSSNARTCASAFWPGVGVEDEQRLVRRRRRRPCGSRAGPCESPPSGASCVGSRPAVSASTTSIPRAFAAADRIEHDRGRIAACLRDHGDAVALAPDRRAARAPRRGTCRRRRAAPNSPCAWKYLASLPIDVVLPAPLTPASMMTNGRAAADRRAAFRAARAGRRSAAFSSAFGSASAPARFQRPRRSSRDLLRGGDRRRRRRGARSRAPRASPRRACGARTRR